MPSPVSSTTTWAKATATLGLRTMWSGLSDRKWAYIRMEGTTFGDVPLNVEMKLEVWDSPNSAGVVIDAVRCCKLATGSWNVSGALIGPSSYFKKSPPVQYHDDVARNMTEAFIKQYGVRSVARKKTAKKKTAVNKKTAQRKSVSSNGKAGSKITMKKKSEVKKTTRRKAGNG